MWMPPKRRNAAPTARPPTPSITSSNPVGGGGALRRLLSRRRKVKWTLFVAGSALGALPAPALAQHDNMPGMEMPKPKPAAPSAPQQPKPMNMPMPEHAGHQMAMTGALGPYPMARESSGTAWQPDESEH